QKTIWASSIRFQQDEMNRNSKVFYRSFCIQHIPGLRRMQTGHMNTKKFQAAETRSKQSFGKLFFPVLEKAPQIRSRAKRCSQYPMRRRPLKISLQDISILHLPRLPL